MESAGIIAAFWILSAVTIGGALAVFLSRNLIHAVVFLVLSFLGMAGLFITLSADFIAVAQILIYAGAVSILMVFAVMLTPMSSRDNANSLYAMPGVVLGIAFAMGVAFVAIDADWSVLADLNADRFPTTVDAVGDLLLGRYLLAFEVASILLLAALIGAIMLVQEDDAP
jgi:NADH-quinone oxidoreductase subunit J